MLKVIELVFLQNPTNPVVPSLLPPPPFQKDLRAAGPPAESAFQVSPFHGGSHPPANLMSTSLAGLEQPAGAAFGDPVLWGGGNKAEQQVWVAVRDDLVVGPSYGAGVIGAPICWSNSLVRPLGEVERSPAGTGGNAGTGRLTI